MKNSEPLKALCGKTKTRKGKLFTSETLYAHEGDCQDCIAIDEAQREKNYEEGFDLEMTDLIAGDELDGVYWAMAQELGEW